MASSKPVRARRGELIFVGCGIQLGRHLSRRVASEIKIADRVFGLVDAFAWDWLKAERPDAIALTDYYGEGKDRRQTYREMEDAVCREVERGYRVCVVLYGHPGVFADMPHTAIRRMSRLGFHTAMEPGISAEACLYADLGLDPGKFGVQSLEATQFLVFERTLDPAGLLILWQLALVGDLSCTRFDTSPERLGLLVDKLLRWYLPTTPVILYEAAQVAVQPVRAESITLQQLPAAELVEHTTLVIPPAVQLRRDEAVLRKLEWIAQ
ncbi:MAG: hypothetical protein LC637_09860 [Xanthomonadaceae bacterium]|nr:hypothetical protein [Xanthomonadaceae bacterium]